MKIRLHVLLSLWLISLSPGVLAQNTEAARLFAEGNRAYEQGNYEEAVRKYEQIAAYGIHNAAVYYNLGNAHYKLNHLGRSILYYEKARRLDPGDRDIAENTSFVDVLRVDKIEEPEPPFWLGTLTDLQNRVSLDTELGVILVLWLLLQGAWAARLVRRDETIRRISAYVMIGAAVLLTPLSLSSAIKIHRLSQNEGIVLADKVDLLSGPGEGNPVLVSVHEGMKVEIRGETPGWYQVILPNGWNGWVPRTSIALI